MSTVFNVYRITNLVNFKLYFGFTSMSIERRWKYHRHSKRQRILQNAIQKWGVKAFTISLESSWPTEEQAKAEEVRLISYWQTNIRRYPDGMGYNMTDGGEGTRGYKFTPEQRDRLSKSHLGFAIREETKQKLRTIMSTPEAKEKMSRLHKGTKKGPRPQHVKDKISASHTGKQKSKSAIEKMRLTKIGMVYSEESKTKRKATWAKKREAKLKETDKP